MSLGCCDCKFAVDTLDNVYTCTKMNTKITDQMCANAENCKYFKKLQFCDTCEYAKVDVYETGTIDCVTYRCILQNNKLIYQDGNPFDCQNAKYPECNLGMYEEAKNGLVV